MPKIKNVSGLDLLVPGLGDRLVLAGQVVDVNADDVWSYTCQTLWEPADKAATTASTDGETAELERLYTEYPDLRPVAPESVPAQDPTPTEG